MLYYITLIILAHILTIHSWYLYICIHYTYDYITFFILRAGASWRSVARPWPAEFITITITITVISIFSIIIQYCIIIYYYYNIFILWLGAVRAFWGELRGSQGKLCPASWDFEPGEGIFGGPKERGSEHRSTWRFERVKNNSASGAAPLRSGGASSAASLAAAAAAASAAAFWSNYHMDF